MSIYLGKIIKFTFCFQSLESRSVMSNPRLTEQILIANFYLMQGTVIKNDIIKVSEINFRIFFSEAVVVGDYQVSQ